MNLRTCSLADLKGLREAVEKEIELRLLAPKAPRGRKTKTATDPLPASAPTPAPEAKQPPTAGPLAAAPQTAVPAATAPASAAPSNAADLTPPAQPAASAARYCHPSNRALCWSGIGSVPTWVEIWLHTGGSMDSLEVAAEKYAQAATQKARLQAQLSTETEKQ